MNKTQMEHAVGRIRQAQRQKEEIIKQEHGWDTVRLSDKEKWSKIKSGEVSMKKSTPSQYTRFFDMFDFSKFEKDAGVDKAGEAKIKQLSKKAEEAIDEIKLGDAQEALEIIRKFRD